MPVADTHTEAVGTPLPFPLPKMPEQKILAWQWNLDFTFLESISSLILQVQFPWNVCLHFIPNFSITPSKWAQIDWLLSYKVPSTRNYGGKKNIFNDSFLSSVHLVLMYACYCMASRLCAGRVEPCTWKQLPWHFQKLGTWPCLVQTVHVLQ